MCGIAGLVRFDGQPVLETDVRSMCRVMVHRGPDEEGVFLGPGVGMGMRRLSIIDLSGGQQPVANEDGSIWVVFNGEIYNYPELREQLTRNGHVLRSESDTETIVHLYEDFGPRCVDHLRGMFAFAVWDTRRRELLLARDRLGIKPLYYAELDGGIAFASELKPILQLPEVSRNLDWEALGHLFTFLATPASQSIVDGVRKLEPGRIATASAGRPLRIDRYWDVNFTPDERASEGDLTDELQALLRDAVRIHQISDVPLGAFLSGGIDSSAVVATMAGLSTGKVKTFSIGFAEAEYDELAHARRVAEAFGTEHHELVLRPDVVQIAEDLAWYLDEPFGDTSAIPTYMVSKLAAEHVTVVLTGDGGDELFGGYDKYVTEEREREFARLPRPIRKLAGAVGQAMPEGMKGRRFLRHLALDGAERYLDASMMFRADELRKLFQPDAYAHVGRHDPRGHALSHLGGIGSDWMSAIQYCDIHTYLPLDILTKVDRMSMAHSIEARPPLLDHKLVEFAARIPARLKLHNGTTKYLLKRAMRGILPNDIIDRQKHGFAVPLAKWFRGELSSFARDLLFSQRSRERGLFNESYIERLLQLHERGRDIDLQLWTLLSLELWCRRVLDAPVQRLETPARATGQRILPAVSAA
jgi:asparagine synthase (glutamine-hydrolysing)